MKIAIFGSYNGGSIGDTAILIGLISSIFRVLGDDIEVTVLALGKLGINQELEELGIEQRVEEVTVNKNFDGSLFGVGAFINKIWRLFKRFRDQPAINKKRIRKVLKDSDVFLIGGGNLIMDLYRTWPKLLKEVCDLSKDIGVPYHFVGVGSAPIDTIHGKNDLLHSLNSAESVFFRDSTSKRYCEEHLGFTESSVGPDLAFGINCTKLIQAEKKNILMLNLAAVYSERWPVEDLEKYNSYLSNMVILVDRLVKNLGVNELIIFNTNCPLDELASEDFIKKYTSFSRFPVFFKFIKGRKTVSRLLTICSEARFSLVTRLHAGIISNISGAHVLAIEYQPKVRDVLENQTSNSTVESIEAVLSGVAFESVGSSFSEAVWKRNYSNHSEVDNLLKLVFKKLLPE
jgi:polysaccharide pyruvyl transferase WcaK-like protein